MVSSSAYPADHVLILRAPRTIQEQGGHVGEGERAPFRRSLMVGPNHKTIRWEKLGASEFLRQAAVYLRYYLAV